MNQNKNLELIGSICVIISAVLFGLMPFLTKIAYAHGGNAYTAVLGRFSLAALILLPIHWFHPNLSLRVPKRELLQMLLISIPYGVTPILLYRSYQYIESGLATTLHFTYPVLVVLLLILFRVFPDRRQILCTAVCTAGILLLYTTAGSGDLKGMLLAVLSGLTFAVYILLLGRSSCKGIPALTLTFWLSLFAGLEAFAITIAAGQLVVSLDGAGFGALVLLALLSTVIAAALFQRGIFLCGEVKGSLLSTLEPLTGLVIGMLVFGEGLSGREWLGVGFVIAAALILVRKKEG